MDLMSQVLAIVIFGALVVILPMFLNKWADSRSGVR
jgi:hypothetical protein